MQPDPTPAPKGRWSRREALVALASAAAAPRLAAAPSLANPARAGIGRPAGLIARENARPGTRDWMLSSTRIDPATKYRCPWIEGYVSAARVRAGDTLTLHVSVNPASEFTLDLYRLGYYGGAGGRHVARLGPFDGHAQPDPPIGPRRVRECDWPPCTKIVIAKDWVSGVYVGKLTALKSGDQSYVIFTVRDDRACDFLYQCSDTTWQAYNRWPSQFSLYDNGQHEWWWGGDVAVSFNRPYGRYCQILDAPLTTGSGEFFLWEFPFVYWLESIGADVSYISNLDTHSDPRGLARARGFLSVGHDEYYTLEMYDHLMAAIRSGLNVAFFSGNTCCGRILFNPARDGTPNRVFERLDVFAPPDPPEPFIAMATLPHRSPNANTLIGARSIPPVTGGADWICSMPGHWIYRNTGMQQGDRIPGLIGWEWHGDPASIPGLEIVATGPTQTAPGKLNGGTYTATVYPGPKGNLVFNASTCWWADGLSAPPGYMRPSVYTSPQGPDRRVQQITLNVLERALQRA